MKEILTGATGVGATVYSFIIASTPVLQWLSALLGLVATGFAIYFYIRKLRELDHAGPSN